MTRKRADRKILTECIGCGKPPPTKDSVALRRLWHTRVIVLAGEPMVESSCPKCWGLYGWGDALVRASTAEPRQMSGSARVTLARVPCGK